MLQENACTCDVFRNKIQFPFYNFLVASEVKHAHDEVAHVEQSGDDTVSARCKLKQSILHLHAVACFGNVKNIC
jgi:hypothetical protein